MRGMPAIKMKVNKFLEVTLEEGDLINSRALLNAWENLTVYTNHGSYEYDGRITDQNLFLRFTRNEEIKEDNILTNEFCENTFNLLIDDD